MAIRRLNILFLMLYSWLFLAAPAAALIYVWYDGEGNAHFSNNPPPAWIRNYEVREYKPGPEAKGEKGIEVPYKKSDGSIIVRAIFNGKESADLLLDTGAAFTIISQGLAAKLNLQIKRQAPEVILKTPDMPVRAPIAEVASIRLGDAELKNVQVAVGDMAPFSKDPSVSGLLGSNFLNAFRVAIDPQQDKIIFQKR